MFWTYICSNFCLIIGSNLLEWIIPQAWTNWSFVSFSDNPMFLQLFVSVFCFASYDRELLGQHTIMSCSMRLAFLPMNCKIWSTPFPMCKLSIFNGSLSFHKAYFELITFHLKSSNYIFCYQTAATKGVQASAISIGKTTYICALNFVFMVVIKSTS